VGIFGWLLVWLIINALFVVWRILVVSPELKTTDQSVREATGILWSRAPRNSLVDQHQSAQSPPH